MASLNRIMIIGYLGKDPELRTSSSGSFCNFSVSTDESYTDRNGNKVEATEWHNVVVNGKQADSCAKWLHKGSLVHVDGKVRTRKWQDKNGQDRYTTEIRADRVQFLDRKESNGNSYQQPAQSAYESAFPSEAANVDDCPF